MKALRHESTLVYYDGPQVIEARDAIGGHYIGVLVELDDAGEKFLIVGTEQEDLRKFRIGKLDLRTLIVNTPLETFYLGYLSDGVNIDIEPHPVGEPIPEEFLPEDGYFLEPPKADENTLIQAKERNSLLLNLRIEPPETARGHRVHANTLAGLLKLSQRLLKFCLQAATSAYDKEQRKAIDRYSGHLLDVVVPAQPGSFRIILEPSKAPDLFGNPEMELALQTMDVLFRSVENPEQVIAILQQHKGHLAATYIKFLKFLEKHDTGFCYTWADPLQNSYSNHSINSPQVRTLVSLLSKITNIEQEEVTLSGLLKKVDVDRKTWRLENNEDSYSGTVVEEGPSLSGLNVGKTYYTLHCIERIEENESTAEETRKLFLVKYEPI